MPTGDPICCDCGEKPAQVLRIMSKTIPFPCGDCSEAREKAYRAAVASDAETDRQEHYRKQIPKLFRQSEISRYPGQWSQIQNWPNASPWLLLCGPSGVCKTRMACTALALRISEGTKGHFVSSPRFAKCVRDQWSDTRAHDALETWRRSPALVLDDIGKAHNTEIIQEALFELVDFRASNLLPTLFTTNTTGEELSRMFSGDRGEPLLRRIREFSEIIPCAVAQNQN